MRRSTLSSMGGGNANSRASLGGGATRKGGGAKSSRMSMQPASSRKSSIAGRQSLAGRRSSAYGSGSSGKTRMRDPRDIKNKSFMNGTIKKVIIYLSERGYDHAISPKILGTPTSKDFRFMYEFLVRQIDPYHKFLPLLEVEVLTTLNHLKYPFSISKGALKAVGSPHTWPHLLACLGWLVELLQYDEESNTHTEDPDEEDSDKFFFSYLGRAYGSFLAGDDDAEGQDAELLTHFDKRDSTIKEEMAGFQSENENMRAEIEALEAEQEGLKALEQRRGDMESDAEKFRDLIEQLQEHKSKMERKKADKEKEVSEREGELEGISQACQLLRLKVDEQEISVGDKKRLQQDKENFEGSLARAREQKARTDQVLYESQMSLNKQLDEVEEAVRMQQRKAEQLKLLPANAKRANGVDYSLRFNRQAAAAALQGTGPAGHTSAPAFLDKDVKREILPHLVELRVTTVDLLHSHQDAQLAAAEKLDDMELILQDQKEGNSTLSATLHRQEAELASTKQEWVQKRDTVEREIDQADSRVGELKNSNSASLDAAQRKSQDLLAEFKETQHRVQSEKQAVNNTLLTLTEVLTNHKEYVQSNLAQMEKTAQEVMKEVSLEEDVAA